MKLVSGVKSSKLRDLSIDTLLGFSVAIKFLDTTIYMKTLMNIIIEFLTPEQVSKSSMKG